MKEQKELYQKKSKQPSEEILSERSKKDILIALEKSYSTAERVNLFGKVMDDYGVDVVVSLIPALGDAGASLVSTLYLLYEGQKVGLSLKDTLKILGYQVGDLVVGVIPVVGDIADYFFKANKRSAKLFQNHFQKLQKKAIKSGLTQKDIQNIQENNANFVKAMDTYYSTYLQKTV